MTSHTNLHLIKDGMTILKVFEQNYNKYDKKIIPIAFNRRDYRRETRNRETISKWKKKKNREALTDERDLFWENPRSVVLRNG